MELEDDDIKSWNQRDDESDAAFRAFKIYRDMGPGRTAKKAYVIWREEEGKPHPGNITSGAFQQWSNKFDWRLRARQYDQHMDLVAQKEAEEQVRQMVRRHAGLAEGFQQKVFQRLKMVNPKELTIKDMARWLDVAVKIERLSRGEATERVRTDGTMINADMVDLSQLTDEEFEQLRKISERVSGPKRDPGGSGSPPQE